jgi:WhiB family redox-sensing transcriptional regulator
VTTFATLSGLIGATHQQDWVSDALCAALDTDLFYPDKADTEAEAKRVCGMCEVRPQCLQSALDNREWGIWGGTSASERQKMLPRPVRGPVMSRVERDAEIMRRVAAGETSEEIAAQLGIHPRTVGKARARARETTQSTVTEAA